VPIEKSVEARFHRRVIVIGPVPGRQDEIADRGVTVNMISPGVVRAANDTDPAAVIARIPARRLTEPGDIAAAVGFLVAEDSGYITGSDLAVNGGLSMY